MARKRQTAIIRTRALTISQRKGATGMSKSGGRLALLSPSKRLFHPGIKHETPKDRSKQKHCPLGKTGDARREGLHQKLDLGMRPVPGGKGKGAGYGGDQQQFGQNIGAGKRDADCAEYHGHHSQPHQGHQRQHTKCRGRANDPAKQRFDGLHHPPFRCGRARMPRRSHVTRCKPREFSQERRCRACPWRPVPRPPS